jgi:hypothetical protein
VGVAVRAVVGVPVGTVLESVLPVGVAEGESVTGALVGGKFNCHCARQLSVREST